jgi:hypothetical protein
MRSTAVYDDDDDDEGSQREIQTPTHWNVISHSTKAHRLCYRPAMFCHLRLIVLLFQQEKFWLVLEILLF